VNSFTGTLPTQLGQLKSLRFFSWTDNAEMAGTIPEEFATLTSLTEVCVTRHPSAPPLSISQSTIKKINRRLHNCKYQGTIPKAFFRNPLQFM
jgi:hypothetical protein